MVYRRPVGILSRLMGGGEDTIARARRPEELPPVGTGRRSRGSTGWAGSRPLAHRCCIGCCYASGEFVLYRVCAIRVEVSGRENLPRGGYVAAAALHRGWVDPLVVLRALPIEPRVWFMGSAASAFDRRWKERLLHRMGGILPVWRGGGIDVHVKAARAVADEGGVLCLFIEGGIVGPPDQVWPGARSGAGLLALRTEVPIVPIALIGSSDLYRGKRISVRILPPVTVKDLLGNRQILPAADSRDELRAARVIIREISRRIDAALPDLAARVADPPGKTRRWSWLTRLFR